MYFFSLTSARWFVVASAGALAIRHYPGGLLMKMVGVGIRSGRVAWSVAVMVLLVIAAPVRGQMSSASNSASSSNCNNTNNTDGFCGSSQSFTAACGGSCTSFSSRYAWNVNADTGAGSTRDNLSTANHIISFNATAVGGYRIDVSSSRIGGLARSSDVSG